MAVTDVERIEVTEVLDAPGAIGNDLVVTPHPLTSTGRVVLRGVMLARGDTLASLLARHGVQADQPGWVVRVGGLDVPAELWARTRAKPGMLIEAHRVAQKSVVRLIALVALAYFTMGTGLAAGGLGGYLGFTGFAAYAVNVGAFMLGSMVINKVLPPPGAGSYSGGERGTTYSLQGARNRARHWEPLGLLFGQVRVAPDFAAQPYSWFEGDDQYQYVQLHAGLNVHEVDDIRIGATDIAAYEGVTVTRAGFGAADGVLLRWESVDTIAGALLDAPTAPGAWVERTSSPNTIRLQVDLTGRLQYIDDKGRTKRFTCNIDLEYRLLPAGPWQPFAGASSTVELVSNTTKPLRRTLTRDVLPGQYAVRARKATKNDERLKAANEIEWAALKSYQADIGSPVARQVVAIKIKASGQLNGVLDQVTWLATSKPVPVWTGSAWVTQVTSNPGAHYLAFCRGELTGGGTLLWGIGKPDDQIDIEGLKAWMVHCAAQGYRFDHWFDSAVSRADVLDAIAAAGMAARSYHTGKLGVVYMASGQPIEAVITMGNIKRGSMRVDYATRMTAEEIEVAGPERTNDWLPASVRVLAPGVTTPRETARLSPAGITTQAGRLLAARLAMAQNIYGRKSVSWEMDLEHLTVRRWSLVALSHDLTQWGHSGRLHAVARNLLAWSEDLRDTVAAGATRPWLQFDDTGDNVGTVLASASPLPHGIAQCTKVQSTAAGSGTRLVYQLVSGTADGQDVVLEVRAQAAECSHLQVAVRTRDDLILGGRFNLAAGTINGVDSVGAAVPVVQMEPTDVAGWWLCRVQCNLRSGALQPYVSIRLQAGSGGANFVATAAGQGLLVAGVTLTPGAGAPPFYVRTTSAAGIGLALDAEVPSGASPYVGLRLPGEQSCRIFGVQPFSGATQALTLAEAWPAGVPLPGSSADNPAMDTLWLFDFSAQPGLRMRVVDIKPTPQLTGARITAVPEPDAFWAYMASGAYTAPAAPAAAAPVVLSNLVVSQQRLSLSYDFSVELDISFDAAGPYDHAQVWGAVGDDPLRLLGTTRTTRLSGWRVVNAGTVNVRVQAFDGLGRPGAVLTGSHLVQLDGPLVLQGNLLPVDELVAGLSRSASGGFMVGQWAHVSGAAAPVGPSSALVLDVGPDGQPAVVWRSTAGTVVDAQGGFTRLPGDPIDPASAYRLAVWVRITGDNSGQYFLGCSGVESLAGVPNPNPYFFNLNRSLLQAGRWYLAVGYVNPAGATVAGGRSGLWDAVTGQKVQPGVDYRWTPDAMECQWRSFQYYNAAAGGITDLASPMVHRLDGTEPSIAALLAMSARGRVAWLTASSQVFGINQAGAASPASITLTALAQNLTGAPTFTVTTGTATLTGSGTARTLAYASMATDSVTVTMTWDGITDTVTIVKVREGANAVVGLLTNESHVVQTAADGSGGSFAGAGGTFKVFDGLVDKTGAGITYSVPSASGVSISIASTGVYTVTGMSADTGTATLRAVYGAVTIDKVYSIAKSRAGADGADGADGASTQVEYSVDGSTGWHSTFTAGDLYMRQRVGLGAWSAAIRIVGEAGTAGDDGNYVDYIFRRAATAPATPTGTGVPAGWAGDPPAPDGNPLWMSKATKTPSGALVGSWSAPVRLDGDDGAPGTPAVSSSLTRLVANFTADSTGAIDAGQTFATTMQVLLGTANDTANWSISRTSSDASITTTLSGATVTVTGIGTSVDSGTVTVTATRSGYPTQTIVMQVGKLKRAAPNNGPVTLAGNQEVVAGALAPANATARFEVRSDGSLWAQANLSGGGVIGNWYLANAAGVGSGYEVRFAILSATGSTTGITSDALTGWAALTSNRYLQVQRTEDGGAFTKNVYSFAVRRTSDGVQVSGGQVYMEAAVEP